MTDKTTENSIAGVVLITGAARRVGAVIAKALHARGCDVILHCRASRDEADALCAQLNALRAESACVWQQNLFDETMYENFLEETLDALLKTLQSKRLIGLVNNASIYVKDAKLTGPSDVDDLASDMLAIHTRVPQMLSNACYAALAEAKGSVVNITDAYASKRHGRLAEYQTYCDTKIQLSQLTLSLSEKFAPRVRVNAVAPGPVLWPEGDNQLTASQKQRIIDGTRLKQTANPHDVAKAVAFLLLDAQATTGCEIPVDGG